MEIFFFIILFYSFSRGLTSRERESLIEIMSETGEGNPAANFKKTVIAQQERVNAVEKSDGGFSDELTGQSVSGSVESLYKAGSGGYVTTRINSGDANLSQTWSFDAKGKPIVIGVTKSIGREVASRLRMERDEAGKFQVVEETQNDLARGWEGKFNAARGNMQAHRNIPSHPKPQSPQK